MNELQTLQNKINEIKELSDKITDLELKDKNNRVMVDALRVKMKSEIDGIYKIIGVLSAELEK